MSLQFKPNEIKHSKAIPHELLEEILLQFAIKNHERTESCKYGCIWSTEETEFIFNICEKLKLKRNVKYLALEIYERFIAEHIVDMRQKHDELLRSGKQSDWEIIQGRIKEQSILRVMTSVQLASKLECLYDNVVPMKVNEILHESGKPYSLNGIFASEMRVLKTLNYKINLPTPALYVELLLYILYTNDSNTDDELYEVAMTVLDFVYLRRTQIYNELFDALGVETNEMERDFHPNFLKVKADYMLLAASIIAGTTYLFINKRFELVLEQLHQICRKVKKDIRSFGIVIAYIVGINTNE